MLGSAKAIYSRGLHHLLTGRQVSYVAAIGNQTMQMNAIYNT